MALMNCKKELGQTNMLIIDIIGNNGSSHLLLVRTYWHSKIS